MDNLESYSTDIIISYYEYLVHNGLFNYEKEIISKFFAIPGKVLDIGCGAGRTTVAIKKLGYDVIGVDYSPKMIDLAKIIANDICYEVQDVRNLFFNTESFDYAIFSFNGLMLIETYEERKRAVLEVYRVLKKNGIFFFSTPFLDNKIGKTYWIDKIKKSNKQFEQLSKIEKIKLGDDIVYENGVSFHLHIPFIQEICDMMNECGYEILYSCRRIDGFSTELLENELDDNYLWVVRKNNVPL